MQKQPISMVATCAGSCEISNSEHRSKPTPLSRRIAALALAGTLVVGQVGCASGDGDLSSEDKVAIGMAAGAVVGGLIGYEFFGTEDTRLLWALGLGAAGAYGGQMLADRLTRYDRTSMQETAYQALTDAPSGATATWQSTNSPTNGSITPLRTFLDAQGRICREYDAQINVGGDAISGRETACLTEAGHWVVYATTG